MNVRLLVLDFDGVLTDNKVLVGSDGTEYVMCDKSDSVGVWELRGTGIRVLVLSNEISEVVAYRCDKLELDYFKGVTNKLDVLKKYINSLEIKFKDVVYVGNDTNDLECIQAVGFSFCPLDAHHKIKDVVDIIVPYKGGDGCVRYVCDFIMEAGK